MTADIQIAGAIIMGRIRGNTKIGEAASPRPSYPASGQDWAQENNEWKFRDFRDNLSVRWSCNKPESESPFIFIIESLHHTIVQDENGKERSSNIFSTKVLHDAKRNKELGRLHFPRFSPHGSLCWPQLVVFEDSLKGWQKAPRCQTLSLHRTKKQTSDNKE